MRVLLITDKSLPWQGGTCVIYHNVYRRLPAGSVTVLTRAYADAAEVDATAGYAIHRVPYVDIPKVRMPLLWLRLAGAAPSVIRKVAPEQIHCGQALETGWIGLWIKRRKGLPYIVHTYLEELTTYSRKALSRTMLQRVLCNADAVTSISQAGRSQLLKLGVAPERIHMLYPGVEPPPPDVDGAAGIRRTYQLNGRPVLLTIARLTRRKGHDRVIEALPRIAAAVPQIAYLIVGPGPEQPRLERLAAEAGVRDRTIFTGPVSHTLTWRYYQAADVFVHPNRELPNGDVEGFGMVFLEANACGLPVIGGNSGGTPDAIRHGVTGYLVDPNNVDEIADRILALLRDPDLRKRMGEAGREWAKQFTWEAAAQTVWDLSCRVARQD